MRRPTTPDGGVLARPRSSGLVPPDRHLRLVASRRPDRSKMNEISRILSSVSNGDPSDAPRLLPLVYDELRRLAAAKLASDRPGQTLQPTALVHEAYLRLVDSETLTGWNGKGHFFGAAAEAMRRILVDNARR